MNRVLGLWESYECSVDDCVRDNDIMIVGMNENVSWCERKCINDNVIKYLKSIERNQEKIFWY